jgi:Phospholipase_D-nuclease N-terminal
MIGAVIALAPIALSIWAIIDVSSHSKVDFYESGSSKTAWIVVIALFTFIYGFGTFIAIFYLIGVRPKVRRIESRRTQPLS